MLGLHVHVGHDPAAQSRSVIFILIWRARCDFLTSGRVRSETRHNPVVRWSLGGTIYFEWQGPPLHVPRIDNV